jgi:hypothetical protein
MDIVPKAFEYYDRNQENNKKMFENVKNYDFTVVPQDIGRNTIIMLDKNNKKILESTYEVVGVYTPLYKLWVWGWAIPYMKKNTTYKSRQILQYGLDIDHQTEVYMRAELITSRMRVTSDLQIDLHIAMAAYLTKSEMIYKYVHKHDPVEGRNNDTIYYLFLEDIKMG